MRTEDYLLIFVCCRVFGTFGTVVFFGVQNRMITNKQIYLMERKRFFWCRTSYKFHPVKPCVSQIEQQTHHVNMVSV